MLGTCIGENNDKAVLVYFLSGKVPKFISNSANFFVFVGFLIIGWLFVVVEASIALLSKANLCDFVNNFHIFQFVFQK